MTRQRRRLTEREQELLAHVRQAQARKISLAEYCRTRGLNVQCVYNLRHRLRGGSAAHRAVVSSRSGKPAEKFIAVQVTPTPTVPAAIAACRLQMKGWVIECASLPPATWLAGLMGGDADAVS
jgi:hypothetical protein